MMIVRSTLAWVAAALAVACAAAQPAPEGALVEVTTPDEPEESSAPPSSSDAEVARESSSYPTPDPKAAEVAATLSCKQRGDTFGCVDPTGETVIPFEFYELSPFSGSGVAVATHASKGFWYIDATGQFLFEALNFDNGPDPLREGRARFVHEGKIGYVDEDFNVVIPPQFDSAYEFRDGKAKVCQGCDPRLWTKDAPPNLERGRVFFIDKQGNEVE